MSTPLPPPPPGSRLGDPVLERWDRGFRYAFAWFRPLVLLAILCLVVTTGALAAVELFAGRTDVAWPLVFWTVIFTWVLHRALRRRR